jgi:hypothetical protein
VTRARRALAFHGRLQIEGLAATLDGLVWMQIHSDPSDHVEMVIGDHRFTDPGVYLFKLVPGPSSGDDARSMHFTCSDCYYKLPADDGSRRVGGEATPHGVSCGTHADPPAIFQDCGLGRAARVVAGLQFVPRMRAPTPGLVVAVGLVVGWSAAQAAPAQGTSRHKKAKQPVEVAPPAPPADDTADADGGTAAQTDAKQVALKTGDAAGDGIDDKDASKDAAKLVKVEPRPADRGWQVEIGPYLWASSVDANVSLGGPVSAGLDIGFIPLERHARYGAEILAEVRHGRFAIYSDFMYGAAAVTGSTSLGPVMVTLTGNASSLLVDGVMGYEVIGDEDAVFSLEARAGIRYQRTVVNGEVDVAGLTLQSPDSVDDGSDAVIGTRAVLRPTHWLFFSGVFDYGVVGASDRTWSASADASLRVYSHVLVTAGWRTLTLDRSLVSLTMQGPRAAVQLVF